MSEGKTTFGGGTNSVDDSHLPAAQRIADQSARLILYPLNNMMRPETADRVTRNPTAAGATTPPK